MRVKLISYYSPNYHDHAVKLIDSCKRWGLDYEVKAVKAFSSWHDGVSCKPKFILQALSTFHDYDALLWVDADAQIVRSLPFGDYRGVDFAASEFQWSPMHKREILTGTMLLAVNERVKMFVQQWAKDVKDFKHSDTPEQDALVPLLKSWRSSVSFRSLDIEWTWIDDQRVKELYPGRIPAIIHKQASRQVRAEEFRRAQAKP